jgi:hypothetical protein
VKFKTSVKNHITAWTLVLLALTFSCTDPNDMGMELLPSTDLIEVKNVVDKSSISAFTFTDGPIRTDQASKNLLGSFYDPMFGKTTINFAAQFRLQGYPGFGTNPVVDSVKLFMSYKKIYGDTLTPQKFRVYELTKSIYADSTNAKGESVNYPYYQDIDLKSMASSQLLGEIEHTPKLRLNPNTNDTLFQSIVIPLDISLGEKFANADSLQMVNNEVFLEFFKGLYIEAEEQSAPGGALLTQEAVFSSRSPGSALAIYYNNDENKAKEKPDTMYHAFAITSFSARLNSIEHDYSVAPFYDNLNQETMEDTLIYVQATGGLKSKIFIDGLSSWKDSSNIVINKAELIFQLDTIASDFRKYNPPAQLILTAIDKSGKDFLPKDYFFSSTYYGGYLRSDYTYRFNIAQHLQEIIEVESFENLGFYLSPLVKSSEANRVALKGSKSRAGIKLVVTYSRFN